MDFPFRFSTYRRHPTTLLGLILAALFVGLFTACTGEADVTVTLPPTSTPASTPSPSALRPVATAVDSPRMANDATPTAGAAPLRLTLSAAELRGLTDAGMRAAVEDLSRKVGGPLAQVEVLRADRVTWRDASLGCPGPDGFYAQVLTSGIWLVLSHEGQEYDYRIAGPRAQLCAQDQRSEPLERQPLEGLWTRLAPMPTSRSEVTVAELNGKIYVFGGFGVGATANEEYDPKADSWRRRAPIPQGVDHAAAVAVGGSIYLIGGFGGRFNAVDTVWAYDPESDEWTRKADLPTPRGALGATVLDGKIYAIGGRGLRGDVGTTEVYDPATGAWSPRSPMPTSRDHLAISVVDDKIYVIGGRLGTFARNLGATEVYDPRTDTWAKRTPFPTVRNGIAGAAVDGKIYVFGGEETAGTFDENERYDPLTDTWQAMPPMPTARHGLGAVAIGDRVYVLAGGPTPGGSASALNEVFIVLR